MASCNSAPESSSRLAKITWRGSTCMACRGRASNVNDGASIAPPGTYPLRRCRDLTSAELRLPVPLHEACQLLRLPSTPWHGNCRTLDDKAGEMYVQRRGTWIRGNC